MNLRRHFLRIIHQGQPLEPCWVAVLARERLIVPSGNGWRLTADGMRLIQQNRGNACLV